MATNRIQQSDATPSITFWVCKNPACCQLVPPPTTLRALKNSIESQSCNTMNSADDRGGYFLTVTCLTQMYKSPLPRLHPQKDFDSSKYTVLVSGTCTIPSSEISALCLLISSLLRSTAPVVPHWKSFLVPMRPSDLPGDPYQHNLIGIGFDSHTFGNGCYSFILNK